mgnify:CR=1 FL=1
MGTSYSSCPRTVGTVWATITHPPELQVMKAGSPTFSTIKSWSWTAQLGKLYRALGCGLRGLSEYLQQHNNIRCWGLGTYASKCDLPYTVE